MTTNHTEARGAAHAGSPLTRRAALAMTAGWAAGLLLAPETAFAETAWWSEADYHGGCANGWNHWISTSFSNDGGSLSNGYQAAMKTPWGVWDAWLQWDSDWNSQVNQILGAGVKIVPSCDFETSLFYKLDVYCLVSAFSSINKGMREKGWHQNRSNDSNYGLYFKSDNGPLSCVASTSYDLNINSDSPKRVYWSQAGNGYRDDWYTDYENWSGTPITTLYIRRGAGSRSLWFGAAVSFWDWFCNYGHGGVYHGSASSPAITFHADGLTAKAPEVKVTRSAEGVPTCGLEWAGRVLSIKSASADKYVCCGNGRSAAANGASTVLWGDPQATNRQWACVLNTGGTTDPAAWANDNRWAGTVSFANVLQVAEGSTSVWLNQYGGGPAKMHTAKGVVYDGDGTAAEGFWVHTDKGRQYIIADSSGLMLDRADGKNDDGTAARFHTDGAAGDLANAAHQWILEDARFSLRPGKRLKASCTSKDGAAREGEARVGDTLSFPDLKPLTYPRSGSGDPKLGYDYMWVALDGEDDGKWLDDQVEVWARAHVGDIGTLPVEQPAINFVGAKGLHALEGVHLRVKGSSLSGGIEYRFRNRSTGKWQDWVSGSADDDGTGSDAWAGEKGNSFRADGFAARLTGELAEKYTLFYEVGSGASGWSAWSKAGEDCIDAKSHFDAICVRILPKWANADRYGFSASADKITATQEMVGKRLAPVCRAYIKQGYADLLYLGTAAGAEDSVTIREPFIKVHYWADGEEMYVQDKVEVGKAYGLSADGIAACKRPSCDGITDFYTDPDHKSQWIIGSVAGGEDIFLYCRNKCTVREALVDESNGFFGQHAPSTDEGQTSAWDISAYPRKSALKGQVYYGDTVKSEDACDMPETVWVDYMGAREVPRVRGGYGSREAKRTDSPKTAFTAKGNMTIYYAYDLPRFDGFTAD